MCLLSLAGCSENSVNNSVPEDYKDNNRYGFGSLIKGKNAVLKKYFSEKESGNFNIEKSTEVNSEKDKVWTSAISVLKEFPFELMDKNNGVLETEYVKIKQFDSTNTCSYKIKIKIDNTGKYTVNILSRNDSGARLKSHEQTISDLIKKEISK